MDIEKHKNIILSEIALVPHHTHNNNNKKTAAQKPCTQKESKQK